jgi:hypothetical protein
MQTRKINIVFVISSIIMFLILNSCKKQELTCSSLDFTKNLIWEDSGCDDSFAQAPTGDEFKIQEGNQYMYPAFNPNNPYEFVFYKIVADSGSQIQTNFQLTKYNFLNNQTTVLLSNTEITGKPTWNKDGWIAYKSLNDGLIYIIKDDGSELKKFSDIPDGGVVDENLTWLSRGNTLFWGGVNLNGIPYLKTKAIGDENIKLIDNSENSNISSEFTVSKNNLLMSPLSNDKYGVSDLNKVPLNWETVEFNIVGNRYGEVNWHVDGIRFYQVNFGYPGGTGLFEVNFETGSSTLLIELCDNEYIKEAVCSPAGDKLILQKIERTLIPGPDPTVSIGGFLIENYSLWLLDLNTLKEARLFKKQ